MCGTSSKPAKPNRKCMSVVPGKIVSVEDVAGPSWSRNNEKNAGPVMKPVLQKVLIDL